MSKAERLKEELGWLKLFFGAFVAIIGLTAGLVFIVRRTYRRLEELKDC